MGQTNMESTHNGSRDRPQSPAEYLGDDASGFIDDLYAARETFETAASIYMDVLELATRVDCDEGGVNVTRERTGHERDRTTYLKIRATVDQIPYDSAIKSLMDHEATEVTEMDHMDGGHIRVILLTDADVSQSESV